jgi:muramidase (phage lysozyme)
MAESLLSRIVKTDKKTFKTYESIDKRVSTIVGAQRKQIKYKQEEKKLNKKIIQEEKRKKADSSFGDKIKNVLGGDRTKNKNWFMDLFKSIGDIFKSITPIALAGAIGIGLIGTAIYKFFSDEKFRKSMMDNVINPLGEALWKGLKDITGGIFQVISGNPVVTGINESAKSSWDDTLTRLIEGVERSSSERALTTIKERLESRSLNELGLTEEQRDLKLKRIKKVLKILRENTKAAAELQRGLKDRRAGKPWFNIFESEEEYYERVDGKIKHEADKIEANNKRLEKLKDKILNDTTIDISGEIVYPVKRQSGGMVGRSKDKQDPRYKLGKMEMRGFSEEEQDEKNHTVIKRQQGGLVLFAGHNDVPNGHSQPGTDAPGTDLQGKYKPTAEQHFADEVARETAALAKKEGVPISYQPSTGRYQSGNHPDSNWTKMRNIRGSGGSAIELHFDAYGYQNGRLIQGTRGMIINGYSLTENEKKIQKSFGTHPTSKSFDALILELDTINKAPGNSKSYARMIVDSMEGVTGPAPQVDSTGRSGGQSSAGAAGKLSSASPPPKQKNIIEMITSGFGVAGQAIGAVYEAFMEVFGEDLGALFDFSGGGTGGGGGNTSASSGGANNVTIDDPNAKAILQAISRAEGTTGSYGTMFGGEVNADLAAGNLTVDEAIQLGMGNPGSGATGKYQFMPQTLRGLKSQGVVKGDEKFTNELQDKAALSLITGRKVNLADGLSKAEVAKLSWEWSSIMGNNYTYEGRPQGRISQDEFLSWYEQYGGKIEGKQTGGIVGTHGSQDSHMMTMSEDQFFERLQEQFEVIDVQYPVTPPSQPDQAAPAPMDFGSTDDGGFSEAMRFAAGSAFS